jgi:hypothetical protein
MAEGSPAGGAAAWEGARRVDVVQGDHTGPGRFAGDSKAMRKYGARMICGGPGERV